jgi:lysophospholipase L1-like esterase
MYRMLCPSLLAVALVTPLALPAPAAAAEKGAAKIKLKKGEHIIFLGDSITQAGAGANGYVTLIRKELHARHPDLDIKVTGAGISGNKVPDLQRRLERDVLKKKPTLVVIYIGINDVWHGQDNPARGTLPDKYQTGLEEVIKRIQDAGAQVLLCTPSVIGEKSDQSNRNDKRLDQYAAISRKVARQMKVPVCDLRKDFLTYLKEHNKENKARNVLTTDGVHLNTEGNKFVAHTILAALGD